MISLKAVSKRWKLPLFFTANLSYEHPPTSASDTPITGHKRACIVDITGLSNWSRPNRRERNSIWSTKTFCGKYVVQVHSPSIKKNGPRTLLKISTKTLALLAESFQLRMRYFRVK